MTKRGRQRRGWVLAILLGFPGGWQMSQAAEFTCTSVGDVGDVACLIDAINEANVNGEENTITLAAGTYTLTTVNNTTDGPNGLPSITSPWPMTIQGAGVDTTIIERQVSTPSLSTPEFRLLHVAATGNLTLNGVTLQHGLLSFDVLYSERVGGAIANYGTATLTNCTLAHNGFYSRGGGIYNAGTLTLTNCTLTGNWGIFGGGGGGIYNYGDSTLTLIHSTLAHNTVIGAFAIGDGGGIYNHDDSSVILQNTMLALNTAPNDSPPADDCFGAITSLGTNLIGDSRGCIITRPQGGSDLTGDPGLDAFTTGDGAPGHGHFPLLETSQAIDAGDDDFCPLTDQLGQPRGQQCDIGVIEFQPSDTTPPTVTIVSVTPDTLWPPNGKLVPVTVVVTITDGEGSGVDPSTVAYEVIDEYGSVQPSDDIPLGDDGLYTGTIQLQASRHEDDADGRRYIIIVYAQDYAGNEGSTPTYVTVPHDRGQRRSITAR